MASPLPSTPLQVRRRQLGRLNQDLRVAEGLRNASRQLIRCQVSRPSIGRREC